MLYKAELFFLYLLAFTLPILEAPKTAAIVFYALCWLAHRTIIKDLRLRSPDVFEWLLLAVVAAGIASTVAGWPASDTSVHRETAGLRDTLTWCGIFWLIYRGGYSTDIKSKLLYFLMAGTAVGLVWGVYQVYTGRRPVLELNSAGIVTQSSIYLGIMLIATFGRLLSNEPFETRMARIGTWVCLALFSAGLLMMGRRGGLLAAGIAILIAVAVYAMQQRAGVTRPLRMISVIVASMALAFFVTPSIFHHQVVVNKVSRIFGDETQYTKDPSLRDYQYGDRARFDCWRIGIAQAIQGSHPLLGIGPKKFNQIEIDKLHFDPPLDTSPVKPPHAHNLFLTKWAEEGLLGLATFLALLGFIAYRLAAQPDPTRWAWTAAMGAWVAPVAAGLFNSPWRHEHAVLAMMLFALYFALPATRRSAVKPG